MIVGVVAVQGDFSEHIAVLRTLPIETREIRLPKDLKNVDGLIIPGGESTTLRKLFDIYELTDELKQYARSGKAIWGTCAGMIMMAQNLIDDRPEPLRLMDITVRRNAYGRQLDSFEADLNIPCVGEPIFRSIFIRAPEIVAVGSQVQVLAHLGSGQPVAVQEDNLLATSFHPELTRDDRIHRYFLNIIEKVSQRQ